MTLTQAERTRVEHGRRVLIVVLAALLIVAAAITVIAARVCDVPMLDLAGDIGTAVAVIGVAATIRYRVLTRGNRTDS